MQKRISLIMNQMKLTIELCTILYGLINKPLQIKTTVSKKGEKISVDFTGSSEQFENASINCVQCDAVNDCVNSK